MRRNMKNKKKKIILIILLLLLILIILCLTLKVIEKKNSGAVYFGTKEEALIKEYLKEKLIPQGTHQFNMNYKGNVSKDVFYESLNNTVNYFKYLSQELEDKDFDEIFKEQKTQIEKYLGIENQDDFEKVCKLLKEKDIQNTEFLHCKIIENTFYVEDIYTKFNMVFYYEDGTEIEVQVGVLNKKASKTFILTIFA